MKKFHGVSMAGECVNVRWTRQQFKANFDYFFHSSLSLFSILLDDAVAFSRGHQLQPRSHMYQFASRELQKSAKLTGESIKCGRKPDEFFRWKIYERNSHSITNCIQRLISLHQHRPVDHVCERVTKDHVCPVLDRMTPSSTHYFAIRVIATAFIIIMCIGFGSGSCPTMGRSEIALTWAQRHCKLCVDVEAAVQIPASHAEIILARRVYSLVFIDSWSTPFTVSASRSLSKYHTTPTSARSKTVLNCIFMARWKSKLILALFLKYGQWDDDRRLVEEIKMRDVKEISNFVEVLPVFQFLLLSHDYCTEFSS